MEDSKKKRVLIILSTQYPYQKSEDFLSNELDYVDGFDEVACFPILVYGSKSKEDIIYEQPVTSIHFSNSLISYKTPTNLFKLLFSIGSSSDLYKELYFLAKTKRFTKRNVGRLISFLLIAQNSINDLANFITHRFTGYDVVFYSYWMHIGAYASIALKQKLSGKIDTLQLIARCHRFDLYEYADQGNYLPFRTKILSEIDQIHSISTDGIKYLNETYSIQQSKVILSRLGSIDRGTNIQSKSDTLRVVSCSWMRPVKRVSSIVEAISMLSVKVDWVHYGDGEEFSKVQSQIDKLENPNITCTLKGAWKNVDVLKDYARIPYDVFINVSENEGVPVSIMEAMSFGKIIIATDVGGTSEIVKDGVNGYLLPKNFAAKDLALLMTKIARMDSDTFNDMCLQSRQIWEERCNAKENYTQFYTKLNYSVGQ